MKITDLYYIVLVYNQDKMDQTMDLNYIVVFDMLQHILDNLG